jgi:phospholipid/cholesterol/gamma-HCH transport system substrate-binding protein
MKTKGNNVKLGAMVVTTVVALMAGLYLIGDKQNLFGDTFIISAKFRDVGGLTDGNNVRFGGIDVGTVESVDIFSDTSVLVLMRIDEKYRTHIHPNSLAQLSSDGVMGNRLVSITSYEPHGEPVADGDMIKSLNSVSMDETTRTLSATNQNLKEITDNIVNITNKLDSSALWIVLQDSSIAQNIQQASYDMSESMNAISESFLIKGLNWKNEKKKKKEEKK